MVCFRLLASRVKTGANRFPKGLLEMRIFFGWGQLSEFTLCELYKT